jgi:hypothetical protein
MSDPGLTLLLLASMVAGPAAAFLVDGWLLAAFAVFPAAGLLALGGRWLLRAAAMLSPAAASLLLGLLLGDPLLSGRALRWAAAIPCGMLMAGLLGTARMEQVLLRAARRMGKFGEPLEVLALMMASAGPSAGSVRSAFRRSRRGGAGLPEAAEEALGELVLVTPGRRSRTAMTAWAPGIGALAWLLFLAGLAGL